MAQKTILILSSEDSIKYELSVDGIWISDSISFHYEIPFDTYNKSVAIEAKFENGKESSRELSLKANAINTYEIMDIRGNFIFAEVSVSPIAKQPLETVESVNAVESKEDNLSEVSNRSLDEVEIADEIEAPRLPEIQGCSYPLGSGLISSKINKIEKLQFQFQRIDFLTKEIERDCFKTADIRKLISTVEYEDQRLELLILAYPNTYDQENYASLSSLLQLKKNQDLFFRFYQRQLNIN